MAISDRIFGANDIRGKGNELSEDIAYRVGKAAVKTTQGKKMVVGHDMRATSGPYSEAVKKGMIDLGADVVDIGLCTTSLFNYAVASLGFDGGVMITASHNPAEYNGFKTAKGGGDCITGKQMQESVCAEIPNAAIKGTVRSHSIIDHYLDLVFSKAKPVSLFKDWKVVVDAGNGMGGLTVSEVFKRLACQMTPMYFEPDGTFPNHEANPAKSETLKDLSRRVVEEQATFGIATDGDGDRVAFVDEKGVPIPGDLLLALLIEERMKSFPGGKAVYSPNASWAVRDAIKRSGATPILERVGRGLLINRMKAEQAVMSGEVSGHYFYPEFSYLESIDFTILLIMNLIARSGKTLSELAAPYRTYANSGEISFEVEKKDEAIATILTTYTPLATDVNTLDGVRIEFNDWWFCVRKSNTEPILRLTLEATTRERMEEKREELSKYIRGF